MSNIDRRPGATTAGRTTSRPLDPVTVAQGTTEVFKRLVHEIAGLVDGSLRYVRLAQRDPDIARALASTEYLGAATAALDRAAALIHDAMRPRDNSGLTTSVLLAQGNDAHTIHETIAHAVAVHRPLAEDRHVTLDADIADDLAHHPGSAVFPIVSNAVRNAIDATPRAGHVLVRARLESNAGVTMLSVEVIDSGPGVSMPEELMFAPGYTTKPSGSGLGLAIARDIAEQLGGEIRLESRTDAPGARFTLRVPLTDPTVGGAA